MVETIKALRPKYGLKRLLEYVRIPRATFYYHLKQLGKPDKHEALRADIHRIFEESHQTYGYRRVQLTLENEGSHFAKETIRRLMREENLISDIYWKKNRDRYSSYRGDIGKVADNLYQQDFSVHTPFTKLATDVTQIKINNDKLYLSAIIDLFSNEVLAYDVRDSPNQAQVTNTLNILTAKNSLNDEVILHSDQGWLYQLDSYQNYLKENNITQSMSRKGNCHDNAPIESFFGLIKREFIFRNEFKDTSEFIERFKKYINWFNEKRINTKKGKTPIQIRDLALKN